MIRVDERRRTISNLDTNELMHMAVHASANGRPDDGIRALKELLGQEPDNAGAHFLLAADYAEIAMLDRAVDHYGRCLELDPELDIARLQFALLLTALDKIDDAKATLEPFVDGEPRSYYTDFAKGLHALFDEKLDEARASFQAGIEANDENVPLNEDFRKIVAQIDETTGEPAEVAPMSTSHLLSAYNKKN